MIDIQCTSCHTRYRIDERVLPADSPTFKCSRCGHVFTTDPIAAKKLTPEAPAKPAVPRASSRPEPKTTPPASDPDSSREVPQANAATNETSSAETNAAAEPKPALVKPYIRNPRPTVFDRSPELPPKPAPEPTADIDTEAVESMRAAVEAPTSKPASPAMKAVPKTLQEWNRAADPTGENLEFDFNDETQPPELGNETETDEPPSAPERWSVGDDAEEDLEDVPAHPSAFGSGELDPEFSRGEPAPIGRGTIPQYAGSGSIEPPLPDERAFVERTTLYSARSFLGLFLGVMSMFVILTGLICMIPLASAELLRRVPMIGPEFVQTIPLESLVSVSDVQSSYQAVKGGQIALVLTGVVKNNSTAPLHTVQIGVRLLDFAQHELASAAVYCGTTLSPKMIGEMTPHELDFLQKLDPQKNFVLEANHTAPFLLVFIDPPRNLNHFAVAIAKAQPPVVAQASTR